MALTLGILALVEAKPGKEAEVEAFVEGGQAIVEREPGTRVWYGFRVNEATFGIFDAFEDESARRLSLPRPHSCSPRTPRFAPWTCSPSKVERTLGRQRTARRRDPTWVNLFVRPVVVDSREPSGTSRKLLP
jgi:hypothetical protein